MTLRRTRIGSVAVVAAASLVIAACGSSSSSSSSGTTSAAATTSSSSGGGTINGAGSTFAAPIYSQWAQNLSSQGLTVNYNPIGSGAGIASLQSATVDFAGSDPPEKATDIKAGKGPVLQFPVAFGAITVSYNLPGVKAGLKLDGPTIAGMYLGTIKTWNDPAIKALNPGVSLPSTAITPVHRSDSSGTTQEFQTFLAATSPAWKAANGKPAKTFTKVVGTGAPKNSGVASVVHQTTGAVGYVEQAYALQNGFTYAAVKNTHGAFITPTLQAATAAAQGIKIPSDLTINTINSPNATAYPITGETFVILYKDMCKAGRTSAAASGVKKFLTYGLGAGQQIEQQLDYASLPAALLAKDQAQLNMLVCNGSPVT
jgi:phosphate transport system substrate-binding protein